MENVSTYIILGVLFVIYLIIFVRFCYSRFGSVKKVAATVIHKQKVEWSAPRSPNGKRIQYAVTFQIGEKTKSFYVSEFSYDGYRKGEKGILFYRGNRLMDFH